MGKIDFINMINRDIADILDTLYGTIFGISRRNSKAIKPTQDMINEVYSING